MAEALRAADLARVGALLAENWRHQQALDPGIRTDEMARLEQAVAGAGGGAGVGVLGGKAAGAGGGGSIFFLAKDGADAVAAAARSAGATVLPVAWSREGVPAWGPPSGSPRGRRRSPGAAISRAC